ncbi:hypothetical protein HNP65_001245 [Thermosipho japonicus]|uniref:Acyltransferase n=1 Tax=Thermosipho japonicus TaxID=90323 RepID=A0A841GS53_9BACT|nr:acyltransferase [Thermosipho japonicus]MBB6062793.1 hypothetical protein [Thermosipho japonicus]
MKKILKKLFVLFSKAILSLFFDRKYLKGKWFEDKIDGWFWAWRSVWFQKILGFNRRVPWPVSHQIIVGNPNDIIFDVDDLNNFQGFGKYFQSGYGKIVIGKGTLIASNVGIITGNHNPCKLEEHLPGKDVIIGENCWIGMNVVILPGVILGPRTIIGAGSVVTHSFPEGNCIIAGNPARIIKKLECKDNNLGGE